MKTILKILTNPLYILLALVATTLLMRYRKKRIPTRICVIVTILFAILITTNPLPEYLVRKLERKYPALTPPQLKAYPKPYTDIIVLGGGYTHDTSLPPNSRLASNSLTRVVEAIRIHRLIPRSKIIFSGKASSPQALSLAHTMAATAIAIGVDSSHVSIISTASTTAKEADYYQKHYHNDSTRLIIVTSAMHMPRAMLTFERRQLSPIPAPTNHTGKGRLARSSYWAWGFSAGNIRKIEKALREMLAIHYEKIAPL